MIFNCTRERSKVTSRVCVCVQQNNSIWLSALFFRFLPRFVSISISCSVLRLNPPTNPIDFAASLLFMHVRSSSDRRKSWASKRSIKSKTEKERNLVVEEKSKYSLSWIFILVVVVVVRVQLGHYLFLAKNWKPFEEKEGDLNAFNWTETDLTKVVVSNPTNTHTKWRQLKI